MYKSSVTSCPSRRRRHPLSRRPSRCRLSFVLCPSVPSCPSRHRRRCFLSDRPSVPSSVPSSSVLCPSARLSHHPSVVVGRPLSVCPIVHPWCIITYISRGSLRRLDWMLGQLAGFASATPPTSLLLEPFSRDFNMAFKKQTARHYR